MKWNNSVSLDKSAYTQFVIRWRWPEDGHKASWTYEIVHTANIPAHLVSKQWEWLDESPNVSGWSDADMEEAFKEGNLLGWHRNEFKSFDKWFKGYCKIIKDYKPSPSTMQQTTADQNRIMDKTQKNNPTIQQEGEIDKKTMDKLKDLGKEIDTIVKEEYEEYSQRERESDIPEPLGNENVPEWSEEKLKSVKEFIANNQSQQEVEVKEEEWHEMHVCVDGYIKSYSGMLCSRCRPTDVDKIIEIKVKGEGWRKFYTNWQFPHPPSHIKGGEEKIIELPKNKSDYSRGYDDGLHATIKSQQETIEKLKGLLKKIIFEWEHDLRNMTPFVKQAKTLLQSLNK